MKKWNLIFDVARCNSCNNCVLATKDEYLGNRFDGYSEPAPRQGDLWLTLKRHERGAAPMIDVVHYVDTCRQCDNPPCINEATRSAISKRPDGIVVIDPVAAKGRKDIIGACPFGQIYWNEEHNLPQKWSFDAHLLDSGWKEPRCTQVCPTQALTAVKLNDEDMVQTAKTEGLANAQSGLASRQRLWFRNFDRVTHGFLGGTLVTTDGATEDCVEGLRIEIWREGKLLATRETDPFGDFKFEPLDAKGESYQIRIPMPNGLAPVTRDVTLNTSFHIGVIAIPAQ